MYFGDIQQKGSVVNEPGEARVRAWRSLSDASENWDLHHMG